MKLCNGTVRIVALLLAALLLCGCMNISAPEGSAAQPQNDPNTLWILTAGGYMEKIAGRIEEKFSAEHEEITVRLERIPNGAEEREIFMEQLRVQIMAGMGPDIYLLPLENVSSSQLFNDVSQCMRNGLFQDISAYYDSDTELDKDGFVSTVMDTGVLGGARYVLPLRFNFPVVYADVQQLEAAGLNAYELGNGLSGLTKVMQTMGSDSVEFVYSFAYFYLHWLCLVPELMDYENQEMLLTEEQLAQFLDQYRELMTAAAGTLADSLPSYRNYLSSESFWALDGHSVFVGSLTNLVHNLRLAKGAQTEMAVIPLRTADGKLMADVTYFGAVGAGCANPELAYEFLRMFLLEEYQWENNLSKESSGLYGDGWPVLMEGSWAELDEDLWLQIGETPKADGANRRRSALKAAELTEADFEILDTAIDAVQFPIAAKYDYMEMIDSQLNPARNPDAMNVDVEELAEEILWDLQWHLAEG